MRLAHQSISLTEGKLRWNLFCVTFTSEFEARNDVLGWVYFVFFQDSGDKSILLRMHVCDLPYVCVILRDTCSQAVAKFDTKHNFSIF